MITTKRDNEYVSEAGRQVIQSIGNLIGSAYADTLIGDAGSNVLEGGAGADHLDGGAGTDTASYAGSSTGVTVRLGHQAGDSLTRLVGEQFTALGGLAAETALDAIRLKSATMHGTWFGNATVTPIVSTNAALTNDNQVTWIYGASNSIGTNNPIYTRAVRIELHKGSNGQIEYKATAWYRSGSHADTLASDLVGGADWTNAPYAVNPSDGGYGLAGVGFEALSFAHGGDAEGDRLANIENLTGSAYADTLIGDAGNNVLDGGAGADRLDGGAGTDTASYAGSSAGVTVDLSQPPRQDLTAWLRANKPGQLQATQSSLYAAGFAASLAIDGVANETNHTRNGAAEWLQIDLGASYAVDRIELYNRQDWSGERLNNATVELLDAAGHVVQSLGTISGASAASQHAFEANQTARYVRINHSNQYLHVAEVKVFGDTAHGGDAEGDRLANIENLTGSAYADTLIGDAGNNVLDGGAGADLLDGGAGNDTVDYSQSTEAVTVNLAGGKTFNLTERLRAAGKLSASASSQWSGYAASNVIDGNTDYMHSAITDYAWGGKTQWIEVDLGKSYDLERVEIFIAQAQYVQSVGARVLLLDENHQQVKELGTIANNWTPSHSYDVSDTSGRYIRVEKANGHYLNIAEIKVHGSVGQGGFAEGDGYASIENVIGSAYDDTLVGDASANKLEGGAGNDTFIGGAGDDRLIGGDGTDTVDYSRSNTAVTISLAEKEFNLTNELRALGKLRASASSENEWMKIFPPQNIIDGDIYTDAIANTLLIPQWFEVDLGASFELTKVDIYRSASADYYTRGARALLLNEDREVVSELGTLETLFSVPLYPAMQHSYDVENLTARFIRVEKHNGYNMSIGEVVVHGIHKGGFGGDVGADRYESIENAIGSAYSDTLVGDAGANRLEGGAGSDSLTGGRGADVFVFGVSSLDGATDIITDFAATGVADHDILSFEGALQGYGGGSLASWLQLTEGTIRVDREGQGNFDNPELKIAFNNNPFGSFADADAMRVSGVLVA